MSKCLRPHHGMCFQFYEGKRFEYVNPAGGNEFTSVKITSDELEEKISN